MAAEAHSRFRRIALSYWTILAIGIVLLLFHAWWFVATSATRRPEAVSGFGASVAALGIYMAVRFFLRKGIRRGIEEMTGHAMPPLLGIFASDGYHAEREAQRPQVRRDVIAERVIGVFLIAIGTLLNGYAAPVARALSLIVRSP